MALLDTIRNLLSNQQDAAQLANNTATDILAQQGADTALQVAQPLTLSQEAVNLASQTVSPILSQQAVDTAVQATTPIFTDFAVQPIFQQQATQEANDVATQAVAPIFQDIATQQAIQTANQAVAPIATQQAVDLASVSTPPILPTVIPKSWTEGKWFLYETSTWWERKPLDVSGAINEWVNLLKDAWLLITNIVNAIPWLDWPEKQYASDKSNRWHIPVSNFKWINEIVNAAPKSLKEQVLKDELSKYWLQSMSLDTFKNEFSPKYIDYYAWWDTWYIDWKAKDKFYGQSAVYNQELEKKYDKEVRDNRLSLESRLAGISWWLWITSDMAWERIAKQWNNYVEWVSSTFEFYKNYKLTEELSKQKWWTFQDTRLMRWIGTKIEDMMKTLAKKESDLFFWYNEADIKWIDRDIYVKNKLKENWFTTINWYLIWDDETWKQFNPDSLIKLWTHINQVWTYEWASKELREFRNLAIWWWSATVTQWVKTKLLPFVWEVLWSNKTIVWERIWTNQVLDWFLWDIWASDLKLWVAWTIKKPNNYIKEMLLRTNNNVWDILPTIWSIYLVWWLWLLWASEWWVAVATNIKWINTIARAIQWSAKIVLGNGIFSAMSDWLNPSNTNIEQGFNMLFDFDLIPLAKNIKSSLQWIDRNTWLWFKELWEVVSRRKLTMSIKEAISREWKTVEEVLDNPDIISGAVRNMVDEYNNAKSWVLYKMPSTKESDAIKNSLNAFEYNIAKLAQENPETANILAKSIFWQSYARWAYTDIIAWAINAGKRLTPESINSLTKLQDTLDLYIKDNNVNVADMIKNVYWIKDDVFFWWFYAWLSKAEPKITKSTWYIIPEWTNLLWKTPEDVFTPQEATAILWEQNISKFTTQTTDWLTINKDWLEYLNIRKSEDYVKITESDAEFDKFIEWMPNKEIIRENANMLADIFSKIIC